MKLHGRHENCLPEQSALDHGTPICYKRRTVISTTHLHSLDQTRHRMVTMQALHMQGELQRQAIPSPLAPVTSSQ